MSSHEALRKRVEIILDMAVSTVSSLTESFMSGIPIGNEDGILSKDKAKTPPEVGLPNKNAVAGDITMANGQQPTEKIKDGEESSDLTEQSDDDGEMLEVHN